MTYNRDDDYEYHVSAADQKTDILGLGEIGGVGQLIYHHVCFHDYKLVEDRNGVVLLYPTVNKKYPPTIKSEGGMTGKEILTSLCNLAKRVNDYHEKTSFVELIINWCKENMHPYRIDYIYNALHDKDFDINGIEGEQLARDAAFSVNDFIDDMGNIYSAARLYIAMDALCVLNNEEAYNMYEEGKFFDTLPVFERFKHDLSTPDIDVSSANGDLLAEMQLYNKYREEHPDTTPEGEFAEEPYDYYEEISDRLVECIPDFRLRLKRNPLTNQYTFSADVDSVFDIAWYTLARMLSEEPPLEEKGKPEKRREGIMICCHNCGEFFTRNSKHQRYCSKPECQNARNAKNQRDHRRRVAAEKAKSKKENKTQK